MRTWVLEAGLTLLLFVALVPAVVTPFVAVVYRRYRYAPLVTTALAVLAGLAVCALVAFTLFPLPTALAEQCAERVGLDYLQTTPGGSIGPALAALAAGPVAGLTSPVMLQVVFNVALFVPLGFVVAYWSGRALLTTVAVGLGASLLIEVTQGTGVWGAYPCPYRVADVDDLLLNTGGAFAGWLLAWAVSRRWPYTAPPVRSDVGEPGLVRRLAAAGLDLIVVVVIAVGLDVVVAVIVAAVATPGAGMAALSRIVEVSVDVALLGLVPALRADRATPGQAAVLLQPVAADGHSAPGRGAIAVRFAVRWLPIVLVGALAIPVVAIAELVTALVRHDRRSLAGLAAGTVTMTRDQVAAAHRASGRAAGA